MQVWGDQKKEEVKAKKSKDIGLVNDKSEFHKKSIIPRNLLQFTSV